ncbi:MAG: sugar ABC transporter permease [Acetivibrio sp.]
MKERRKKKIKAMAFLSPSLLGLLVFFVLPFFVVMYYAVVDNPIHHEFVFLDNFISVMHNQAFLQAAKNTAVFSAVVVPLAVVLSLILAVLLDSRIPFKSQFRTFFLSPMMVPVASIVLIWQVLFHYNGAVNGALANFGMLPIDWLKSDYSQIVIVILFLWKNLGYDMILFMAALGNIPRELIEVTSLDTSSGFVQFFYIKLRYLSPTILFVTILSLINSFKIFREVYLLTGDYPYDTLYMLQNFMNNTFKSMDYQKLSSAAILMAIVMVIIIGILFFTENKFGEDVEG